MDGDKEQQKGKGADVHDSDMYEEQYDPNQEFRIFGVGD